MEGGGSRERGWGVEGGYEMMKWQSAMFLRCFRKQNAFTLTVHYNLSAIIAPNTSNHPPSTLSANHVINSSTCQYESRAKLARDGSAGGHSDERGGGGGEEIDRAIRGKGG